MNASHPTRRESHSATPAARVFDKFGPALFGRGAFDLARPVRREVSKIELDALPRLVTDAERQTLGFR